MWTNRWMRLLSAGLAVVTALSLPFAAYAKPDWPTDTGIESEAGIVMDMDSEAVLFGQNIHERKAPASITKLMTALVVLEDPKTKLDDKITISAAAMNNVDSDSGNKLALAEGDVLSVKDCLYLMLLQSSNQSANALAEYAGGSQADFVKKMNQRAKKIGCGENTHFANPSGLSDDNQYTTAYDMALISRAAFENKELLTIASAKSYTLPPTKNNPNGAKFEVEHKLVKTTDPNSQYYYPYAVAGKTGFTSSAGQTLVTLAKKDGRSLICVTLKSSEFTHYKDTIALLNFGFDSFQDMKPAAQEAFLSSAGDPVELGGVSYAHSDLTIDPSGTVTLPKGAAFTDAARSVDTTLPTDHPEGAVARLVYKYDDRTVGDAYIISAKKVQEEEAALHENGAAGAGKGSQKPDKTGGFHIGALLKTAAILILAVVLIGALMYFFNKGKQAEKRRQAERRKKRMQRLKEMGSSEEEFNRMLRERFKRKEKDRGKGKDIKEP